MSTPTSTLRLLNDVNITESETVRLSSAQFQSQFFIDKTWRTYTNVTYIRENGAKGGYIKIGERAEDVINNSNYLMFNNNVSGKWFYAFIDSVEYVNEKSCKINLTIDSLQTYMYDMDIQQCYVEREHVNSDVIGEHTVDENLDVGEYNVENEIDFDFSKLAIVLGITFNNTVGSTEPARMRVVGGIFTGIEYIKYQNSPAGIGALEAGLQDLEANGQADKVVSIFMMPDVFFNDTLVSEYLLDYGTVDLREIRTLEKDYSPFGGLISGYTPKNNKLFTYPYNFMRASNNTGQFNDWHYELIDDSGAVGEFQVQFSCDITPSPTLRVIPFGYRGKLLDAEASLTLTDYPICAWSNSLYQQWQAQSKTSNAVQLGGSIVAAGVGLATGNPLVLAGAIGSVANMIGNFEEKSLLPNKFNGSFSGASSIVAGVGEPIFYSMRVSKEYAQIIDEYFSRFGYKINRLKIPNITGRANWNYIKTREANIYGDIPRENLDIIRNLFNSGVTFWHTDNVGDYSLDNSIL